MRERLELFVPVCEAIQHAHQKGVIHRDIKPSNVLVAPYDDRALPKVIDFGVAKATGQSLTDKTLITGFGAIVGTPEYMSPEQANLNNLDIDTRSDIYSLGVLLYELLTGTTPMDRKSLGEAAILEVLRVVREVEAPRPSTMVSSSAALPSIAANRNTEPAKLSWLMKGELDWVLLKALEKDRTRRYETAIALARDIQRYLSDEVVEARPPSTGYWMRKFVHRHKAQVVAASLVLLALLVGIAGTTFGFIRAEQQRQRAEEARGEERQRAEGERKAKLDAEAKRAEAERQQRRAEAGERLAEERLRQVDAERRNVEDQKKKVEEERQVAQSVRDFLENKLLGQADAFAQADALVEVGRSSAETKLNPTIREVLDRAALELAADKIEANFPQQPRLQAELLKTVGDTYLGIGEYGLAIAFLTRAADLQKTCLGAEHSSTLTTLNNLALACMEAGKLAEAIVLFEQVRDAQVKTLGANHPKTLTVLHNLAMTYHNAGKLPQAIALFEQVRDAQVTALGADHRDTLTTLNGLGLVYMKAGKLPQAIELLEPTSKSAVKKLGADHPVTLAILGNLALAYLEGRKLPQAIPLFEQVRDAEVKKLGADHPLTLTALNNLAGAYQAAKKLPEAIELYKQVHDIQVKKLGADHPSTLNTLYNLASAYQEAGKLAQAIELFERVCDAQVKALGADHPATLKAHDNVAGAYEAAQQFGKAEACRRKWLPLLKRKSSDEPSVYANELASLGLDLLRQKKYPDAEPVLRECLGLREKLLEKKQSAPWRIANVKSMLGESLLGQKQPAEAEPLLITGYEGLKQDEKAVPEEARQVRMTEAIQRLIDFATATNRRDDVKKWKAEQAKYRVEKAAEKN